MLHFLNLAWSAGKNHSELIGHLYTPYDSQWWATIPKYLCLAEAVASSFFPLLLIQDYKTFNPIVSLNLMIVTSAPLEKKRISPTHWFSIEKHIKYKYLINISLKNYTYGLIISTKKHFLQRYAKLKVQLC